MAALSKWPRSRKPRLFILPEVNTKENKNKDNINIFTYNKFYARFTANADGLYTTILSIIKERDSLIKKLNKLYIVVVGEGIYRVPSNSSVEYNKGKMSSN
jgi:hypothetical protein